MRWCYSAPPARETELQEVQQRDAGAADRKHGHEAGALADSTLGTWEARVWAP